MKTRAGAARDSEVPLPPIAKARWTRRNTARIWKSARQPVWKPALRSDSADGDEGEVDGARLGGLLEAQRRGCDGEVEGFLARFEADEAGLLVEGEGEALHGA